MDKQAILALMIRNDSQLRSDPFTLSALLAECLETIEGRLTDQDFSDLIRIGAGVYQVGVDNFGDPDPNEDLFPAHDNFPWCALTSQRGYRRQ